MDWLASLEIAWARSASTDKDVEPALAYGIANFFMVVISHIVQGDKQ